MEELLKALTCVLAGRDSTDIVRGLASGGVVLFGLLAASIQLYQAWQREPSASLTRKAYAWIWTQVDRRRLLQLPQLAINLLVNSVEGTGRRLHEVIEATRNWWPQVNMALGVLSTVAAWAIGWRLLAGLVAYGAYRYSKVLLNPNSEDGTYRHPRELLFDLLATPGHILAPVALLTFAVTKLGGKVALVALTAASPLLVFSIYMPLGLVASWVSLFDGARSSLSQAEDRERQIVQNARLRVISATVVASFVFTLAALRLGEFVAPGRSLVPGVQLLLANAICDGLTLGWTLAVLKWALASPSPIRLSVAIALDLLASAALACASIYLGLVGTAHSIAPSDTLWLLVGATPGGFGVEFGPLFWVMHTAFIPTLAYLGFLCLMAVGKLVVLPVARVAERAGMVPSPDTLSAALLGLVAAVLTIPALLL